MLIPATLSKGLSLASHIVPMFFWVVSLCYWVAAVKAQPEPASTSSSSGLTPSITFTSACSLVIWAYNLAFYTFQLATMSAPLSKGLSFTSCFVPIMWVVSLVYLVVTVRQAFRGR